MLNDEQSRLFKKQIDAIAERVLRKADVTVCTIAQLGSNIIAQLSWDLAVVDEASVATELECVQVLRKANNTILVGDPKQLGPVVLSTRETNPFKSVIDRSLMERMIACGYPHLICWSNL